MNEPKSYRDLKYEAVVAYGDKKGLNTETHENWRMVAQQMFNEKYGKKKNKPTDRMGEYLKNTDFKLLKKQKTSLINIQSKLNKKGARFTQNDIDTLEGIINLVDSIQDIAVDEYGYSKFHVFKLSRKDK